MTTENAATKIRKTTPKPPKIDRNIPLDGPLTEDQKQILWRNMANATLIQIANLIQRDSRNALDTMVKADAVAAQRAINRLCGRILDGRVSVRDVEFLTWLPQPNDSES